MVNQEINIQSVPGQPAPAELQLAHGHSGLGKELVQLSVTVVSDIHTRTQNGVLKDGSNIHCNILSNLSVYMLDGVECIKRKTKQRYQVNKY